MNLMRRVILTAILVTLAGNSTIAQVQAQGLKDRYDRSDRREQVRDDFEDLLRDIDNGARNFQRSLDRALDDSRLDGTRQEDNLNQVAKDLRNYTDRLKDDFNDNKPIRDDVEQVLSAAQRIEDSINRRRSSRNSKDYWEDVRRDWDALRTNLNRLQDIANRVDRTDRSYRRY
jgi:hypothetical protein